MWKNKSGFACIYIRKQIWVFYSLIALKGFREISLLDATTAIREACSFTIKREETKGKNEDENDMMLREIVEHSTLQKFPEMDVDMKKRFLHLKNFYEKSIDSGSF
jgi:hypothetical protein